MSDINELVQEFWRTSSDGAVDVSFCAPLRLLEILQECFDLLEMPVCLVVFSVSAAVIGLAEEIFYRSQSGALPPNRTLTKRNSEPNLRYCFMSIERSLINHFLHVNPKIWVTCSDSYLVS